MRSLVLGLALSVWVFAGGCTRGDRAGASTGGDGIGMPAAKAGSSQDERARNQVAGESLMSTTGVERVMFGAGCFWGVEARFMQLEGVTATAVGYSGGRTENPTYKQVCTDTTGHAEVVYVEYDPSRIGFEKLLDVFFTAHDPTQVNRQGPDVGSQYRSAIYYYTPAQQAAAVATRQRLEAAGRFKRPIATQVEPAGEFWKAEEYHQKYLQKRGLTTCGTGDPGH